MWVYFTIELSLINCSHHKLVRTHEYPVRVWVQGHFHVCCSWFKICLYEQNYHAWLIVYILFASVFFYTFAHHTTSFYRLHFNHGITRCKWITSKINHLTKNNRKMMSIFSIILTFLLPSISNWSKLLMTKSHLNWNEWKMQCCAEVHCYSSCNSINSMLEMNTQYK